MAQCVETSERASAVEIHRTEHGVRVPKAAIVESLAILAELSGRSKYADSANYSLRLTRGVEAFTFDSIDEWYGEYNPAPVRPRA